MMNPAPSATNNSGIATNAINGIPVSLAMLPIIRAIVPPIAAKKKNGAFYKGKTPRELVYLISSLLDSGTASAFLGISRVSTPF